MPDDRRPNGLTARHELRSDEQAHEVLASYQAHSRTTPLDPASEARIWQHLRKDIIAKRVGRAQRLRWPLALGLGLATSGILAIGVAVFLPRAPAHISSIPQRSVAEAKAQALVATRLRSRGAVTIPTPMREGSRVGAGTDAHADFAIASDLVRVTEDSSLVLDVMTHRRVVFSLQRGRVLVHADPTRSATRTLIIESPFGEVAVVGTVFEVDTRGGGRVATLRGTVNVQIATDRMKVASGYDTFGCER